MYEVAITIDEETIEIDRFSSKAAAVQLAHGYAFKGFEVSIFDYEANKFIFDSFAV